MLLIHCQDLPSSPICPEYFFVSIFYSASVTAAGKEPVP